MICAYVHIPDLILQSPRLEYEVVPIHLMRSYFTYGVLEDSIKDGKK